MALFTSAKGYFEVTAVSFSPNVITVGEETTYSVTIKNVSGKKITSMYLCMGLYYPDAADRVSRSTDVYMYGGPSFAFASVSWAANASKTFTGTFKFTTSSYYTYLPNITTRLMPLFDATSSTGGSKRGMMIQIVTDATFADGTNHDNIYDIRGENSEYLAVIDARYNPAITIFSAERCMDGVLNDEGENIMTDLQLSLPDNAITDGFTMKFYYARDADATTGSSSVNLTSSIPLALTGISNSTTLITQTFDKASDWGLMITFGDAYESTTARADLARSFANMHLSGHDTGGVCFVVHTTESCYPDESKLLPGDCLYFKGNTSHPLDVGHVEMYTGPNECYGHGSGTGPTKKNLKDYCKSRATSKRRYFMAIRWILDDADGDTTENPVATVTNGITITNGSWNVRTGPGSSYDSVGTVRKGDVLEKVDIGTWVPVIYNGKVRYISPKAVK